ncbi:MAG TPA: FtsX-like permease family protein, partial [Gammaproteobacteria bacterium]|nr:FtsX-like permease family protein [Gammaproteobacteria bacterium]
MSRVMWRASGRYMLRHRWQIGLSLLGVALGVAVVIAVDLAGDSAQRAFALSRQILEGRTTHQIVGGPGGLPQGLYRTLRVDLGLRAVTPVIEDEVETVPRHRVLQLTGIDPFAGRRFHAYLGGADSRIPLSRLLTEPATGLLTEQAAARLGVSVGESLTLQVGTRRRRVTIIGLLHPAEDTTRHALTTTLLTDIATAQELLGRGGRITRLDLIVPQGRAGRRELARIRAALPPGARIIRSAAHARALANMTHAFRSNLAALSLLALIVGVFLVYNTMTFSVVQRRHLLGLLRALGATRREIFTLVLGEAFVIGCLGTLAGLALGIALAHGLVHLVTRTINDLYFTVTVQELALSPASLLKGGALGIGLTLVAAWLPALEATRAPPRAALSRSVAERRAYRALPAASVTGLGLSAAGGALLYPDMHSLTLSYAGVLLIILGFALLTPLAIVAAAGALRPLFTALGGAMGAMVTRGVTASLSRTGVAVAALTIAIAATIAVGVMIGSFRDTLANWLKTYLRSDIYVSSAGGAHYPLPPQLVKRLVTTPGVATYSTGRYFTIDTADDVIQLLALHLPPQSLPAFRFKEG